MPPELCARCRTALISCTMSRFNADIICEPCEADERDAPGYFTAHMTEDLAVQQGDYNFPGVGLSQADLAFLAERRAQRKSTR